MPRLAAVVLCLAGWLVSCSPAAGQGAGGDARVADLLEPIRQKHGLPAMGGAILTGRGLAAMGVVGVRKTGTDIPATTADAWHLGSDTKAMTAAMIGALVERGRMAWDMTIGDVFPDIAATMPEPLRTVTVRHLLSHRSGLPANIFWGLLPKTGTTREQRLAVIAMLPSVKLVDEPGAKFLYSNLGYVVAGAMAEKTADASWEDLMKELLFKPLGITSVGFGGLGTPGIIDQPWPHKPDGKPEASNGPDQDNPAVLGPAGTVHCTLEDWAGFVADQLRGTRGEKALLKAETYKELQTAPFGGTYVLGWLVTQREWGGGTVLTHNGSNSMNLATVWMAPLLDCAVLVVTNQGGPDAAKACDEAAGALIKLKLQESTAAGRRGQA